MPRLIWSPASRRDLGKIDAYLAERNDAAAARILRAIQTTAERLRDHPRLGPTLDDSIRTLTVRTTPYLMLYRVHGKDIDIVRIHHAKEDWRPVRKA